MHAGGLDFRLYEDSNLKTYLLTKMHGCYFAVFLENHLFLLLGILDIQIGCIMLVNC